MIETEKHGKVSLITFNDGKVNVLNEESLMQLGEALDSVKESGAIVLAGAGKCFSAGLDLKRMSTLSRTELANLLRIFGEVVRKVLEFPCPVVAAVNGHAIAGGAVMTLSCDVAVGVQQELKIGLSEVAVGMPLPKLVVELARARLCPRRLTEAVLFGKLYSWEEALEVGYLHQSASAEALVPTCLKIAEQLSALPREAYSLTKKELWSTLPATLGAEAVGSFLTEGAKQHMSGFQG